MAFAIAARMKASQRASAASTRRRLCPAAAQRVDGVTSLAEEEVPVQPSIGLHVSDGGFNGRSSPQLATHGGGKAAPAAGDHHLARAGVVVAAIALVDV